MSWKFNCAAIRPTSEARCVKYCPVKLGESAGQLGWIDRHRKPVSLEVFLFHSLQLCADIRVAFLVRFDRDDLAIPLTYFLGEEARHLTTIGRVGMQNTEASEAELVGRISRDAFGLQLIGQRGAERQAAEASDIRQCGGWRQERRA